MAKAVTLARVRSTEKDLAFAVSQLVDVGTYALQERWDTATTHEVMVHLGNVLAEIVDRRLPRLHDKDADGRCIYDETGWEAVDVVRQSLERLRGPAAGDPEVALHLMQMLQLIRQVAGDSMATDVISEVEQQVELIVALAKNGRMLAHDLQRLEREAKVVFKSSIGSDMSQGESKGQPLTDAIRFTSG